MSKSRRRKNTRTSMSTSRRLVWGAAIAMVAMVVTIALTEPRQLPAVVADHAVVRTAYIWRDSAFARVHNWVYPLASLRQKESDTSQDGVGYKDQDRAALDKLLESKDNAPP